METKGLITTIVGVVVSVIIVAACLMPVLSDAVKTEDTFTNEGVWRMKEITENDVWVKSSSTWTYDGTDSITYTDDAAYTNIALGKDWCVRANGQARGHSIGGNTSNTQVLYYDENSIKISGIGLNGNGTQSAPGYAFSSDGTYTMLNYGMYSYLKGDSLIFATGSTQIGTTFVIIHIEGNIDDGITIEVDSNYNNSGTPTISNVVITNESLNYTAVDGYIDLYKLTSITFDLSFTLTSADESETADYSGSVNYSSYIVPYQVTAERAVHFSPGEIGILSAIPIMIIVAILLMAVSIINKGRE